MQDAGHGYFIKQYFYSNTYDFGFSTKRTYDNYSVHIGRKYESSTNRYDLVIALHDANESFVSGKLFNLSESVLAYTAVCDSSGNTFILLSTYTNFVFLIKLDTSLNISWSKKLDVLSRVPYSGGGVVVDASGNVFIATMVSGAYGYISKYNSTGTLQFQRKINQFFSGLTSIDLDSAGNILVCAFTGLIKINSSGTLVFFKSHNISNLYMSSCVVDKTTNNVYLSGYDQGNNNAVIAKLDSSGNNVWSKSVSGASTDYDHSLILSQDGHLYATSTGSSGSNSIIKYTTDGSFVYSRKIYNLGWSNRQPFIESADSSLYSFSGGVSDSINDRHGYYRAKLPSDGSLTGAYRDINYLPAGSEVGDGPAFISNNLYTLTSTTGVTITANPTITSSTISLSSTNIIKV